MGLTLRQIVAVVVLAGLGWVGAVSAQTNSWLGGSGGWQTTNLWSLDQTPSSNQDILVTNTGTFTITIDDNTASNFPGTLTISNLTASDSSGTSTLLLTNRPTSTIPILLTIADNAFIGTGAVLNAVDTSAGQLGVTVQASGFTIDGTVLCQGNAVLQVGGSGGMNVGVEAGANGIWQIAGGSNSVNGIGIGVNPGATGEVVMTGGELSAPFMTLGGIDFAPSIGSLFISNGAVNLNALTDGDGLGGVANVTVAGGSLIIAAGFGNLYVGEYAATGTLWLTGGQIDVLNNGEYTGIIALQNETDDNRYYGQLVCSGGVLNAAEVRVGHNGGDPGTSSGTFTWNIVGGTSTVSRAVLVMGYGTHYGSVNVSGGQLQTAMLELGTYETGGAVTISGGQVQVTSRMDVGVVPGAPSVINVTGGNLKLLSISSPGSELPAFIGSGSGGQAGAGQLNISSGSFTANVIEVGATPGSVGTLNVSGGLVDGTTGGFGHGTSLLVGEAGATGAVIYTGGNLYMRAATIGDAGYGSLSVSSNANFAPLGIRVGNQSGAVGLATIQAGTFSTRQTTDLEIGLQAASTGTVWVVNGALVAGNIGGCGPEDFAAVGEQGSGRLSATNSTLFLYNLFVGSHGTLECVNSQLSAGSGGCLSFNSNVMLFVNSTGTFDTTFQNNATLLANGSTLIFQQPVNNSGWIIATNGWLLFQSSVTNSGAVLLGPNQFRVTSVTATGSDAAITWQAFGGNDYRVQAGTNPAASFSDISTDIVAIGNGPVVTNFIDHGALTNATRRFYRVRQLP